MGLFDIADKVKQFISGEVSAEKNNQAIDAIQQASGIRIDDKQRAAMIKAKVPLDSLLTAITLKQLQSASTNPRASQGITQLQQPGGFEQIQAQMPGGGSISQGGVTATIPMSPELEKQKNDIEIEKQNKVIAEKSRKSSDTNLASAQLKFDSLIDTFGDYSIAQKSLTGMDPGPVSGLFSEFMNKTTRANEFQNALKGAALEIAAASYKSAAPESRGGVQMIKMFSQGVLGNFDTVEAGVVDTSKALKSILMQNIAENPDDFIPNFSKLSKEEKIKVMSTNGTEIANRFEQDYKSKFFNMALKKQIKSGVDILKPETYQKLIAEIPNFKSSEEGDLKMKPGELYIVNGELMEAGD